MAPRRSTRLVKADAADSTPAPSAPTAKAPASTRARKPSPARGVVSTRRRKAVPSASDLSVVPSSPTLTAPGRASSPGIPPVPLQLREVALILCDVHRPSVTALASTCRLIDDVIAPIHFEVVRFERYIGPPLLDPRPIPLKTRKRKRRNDSSDESSDADSELERWEARKTKVQAWTDDLARYVRDVLPGRGEHLRFLFMLDEPARRANFVDLLAAVPNLRFLGLTLCRDSSPDKLGVCDATVMCQLTVQLASCTSIEALQIGVDNARGAWSGPHDSPLLAARVISALPGLQELVLVGVQKRAAGMLDETAGPSHVLLSSAVWSLTHLHTLTLDRSDLLNPPLPTRPRPPISCLTLRTAGPNGRWSAGSPEASPDALIEAFAFTLEDLTARLRPSTDVLSFNDLSEATQISRVRDSPIRYYETMATRAPDMAHGFGAGLWTGRTEHPFAKTPNPNVAAIEQLLDDPTALTTLVELNLRRAPETYYYPPWRLEDHVDGLIDRLSRRGASLFIEGTETVVAD